MFMSGIKTAKNRPTGTILSALAVVVLLSVLAFSCPGCASGAAGPAAAAPEKTAQYMSNTPGAAAPAKNLAYHKPDKVANVGKLLTFAIAATDPDGDMLQYSASNLPDGASFDNVTLTFSWTPRFDQAGVYSVTFEVSDGDLTDTEDITITVLQLYDDWDVNGDGAANILDMVLVGQHWGQSGLTGWIQEDTNEDGAVDVLDIVVIGQHWTG
ncbi:MAG: hypothetical protein A2Y92_00225 [Chloroflexi bacterium RBG_13_57_8]|nr:MAG: hypothetical protein A2Y92_00225 [Chloroflexi bacterium RBG_13_57_8]